MQTNAADWMIQDGSKRAIPKIAVMIQSLVGAPSSPTNHKANFELSLVNRQSPSILDIVELFIDHF